MTIDLQRHCRLLLESHRRLVGRELLPAAAIGDDPVQALFNAPFVLVSHGTEPDPVLNFGNRKALELWEMDWDELTRTPSRLTAEAPERGERERLLAQVARHGFIGDYSGIRISKSGRRFRIARATVWNLADAAGLLHGQAAAFSDWTYL